MARALGRNDMMLEDPRLSGFNMTDDAPQYKFAMYIETSNLNIFFIFNTNRLPAIEQSQCDICDKEQQK